LGDPHKPESSPDSNSFPEEDTMDHKRSLLQIGGLTMILVLLVACGAQTPTPMEGVPEQIPVQDLPQAGIGEELVVGDTMVLVADARSLESIEVDIGFGPSKLTPDEPGMLFLDVAMTISNLRGEDGVLEEEDKGSIFTLIGSDGKICGALGHLSDPAIAANETRDISKTFVVHQDAVQGARLHVKDIFSDQEGVILLSK
jgi:hypothetical protein